VRFFLFPVFPELNLLSFLLNREVTDDLLARGPVSLEWDSVGKERVGRRIMITGGAGSIGPNSFDILKIVDIGDLDCDF